MAALSLAVVSATAVLTPFVRSPNGSPDTSSRAQHLSDSILGYARQFENMVERHPVAHQPRDELVAVPALHHRQHDIGKREQFLPRLCDARLAVSECQPPGPRQPIAQTLDALGKRLLRHPV